MDLLSLFLLAKCPILVHAVKINECGDRLREAQAAAWNVTHPSIPPPPFELTYQQCLAECGGGLGNISWSVFSQSVITWFLPWVVLSFQIPFGAECEPFTPMRRLRLEILSKLQIPLTIFGLSSSPSDHLLSPRTRSKSRTSMHTGSLKPFPTSTIQIPWQSR